LGQHDITPQLLVITDVFLEPLPKDNHSSLKAAKQERSEECLAIEKADEHEQNKEREIADKQEQMARDKAAEHERSELERRAREQDAKQERSDQKWIAGEAAKANPLEQEQIVAENNFVITRKRKPSQTMKGILEEDEQNTQYQPQSKKNKTKKCELPKTLSISNKVFHNNESGPLFQESPCPSNRTIFKVTEVMGDGNCLYRSLSQSRLFQKFYPNKSHLDIQHCL
jgi:hypothetical protein